MYLRQLITFDKNMEKEINRRIGLGWAAYSKHREILESNIHLCLKRKIINQIVFPSITYGSEPWIMSKEVKKKLLVAQRKIERKILGITLRDRRSWRTNEWIQRRTRVDDIGEISGRNKCGSGPDMWPD